MSTKSPVPFSFFADAKPKRDRAKQHLKSQHGETQQQATQEQLGNFKKAFSVCLEAKDYLEKYHSVIFDGVIKLLIS